MELTFDGLCKSFAVRSASLFGAGGTVTAVKSASGSVPSGQCLGIVGESGSGKTTIAKILAGFLDADAGRAALGGADLLKLPASRRAALVQMVFQDPFASLNPKLPLSLQLREALARRSGAPIAPEALLADVGLPADTLERYPHQLSGGQRQRFAIARALAVGPRLLIADEPVSSLDLSVQAQIINLLNRLRSEVGFTQIVISHDLAVIANMCERCLVMKDGEIVEAGDTDRLLSSPAHPYTRRLLEAAPVL